MKKMNFYFNSNKMVLTCMMMVALFVSSVSAQCPPVNFTYTTVGGGGCSTQSIAGIVPTGNAEVFVNGIWNSIIDPSQIGKTLQYRALQANGSMCWNNVVIEDKSAPVVTAPAAITLNCDAPSLAPSVTGMVPLNKTTGATGGKALDCSALESVYYSDVETNVKCDGSKTVTRSWFAKDVWGNVSGPGVTQAITLRRSAVSFAAPADVTVSCTDAVPAIVATSSTVCAVTTSFLSEMRVNLCGNTYKLVRTYQVVDACPNGSAGMSMNTANQTITVKDVTTPSLTVAGISYDLVNGPTYTTCGETTTPKKVQPANATVTAGAAGTLANPIAASTGTIAVTAWADASMCGAGTFSLNVSSSDNCTNGSIITSDSRYRVVGGVISGRVMGNTTFDVVASDACGNTTTVTVIVNVVDNVSPTAICDGVTATLNNYKQAVITGASFNHSSNDNCGIVRILVAKANTAGTVPSAWCDNVTYTCDDLTSTTLKVWVRYVDAAGNFTDCCVPLTIVDKATISCLSPVDFSVPCNDPRLINVGSLFTAPATFYDGCSTPAVVVTNTSTSPGCGANTFTRTWRYTVSNSLTSAQSVTCSQTISTTAVRGFRVRRLDNQDVTCSGSVTTLKQDQDAIIASMQLLHSRSAAPRVIAGLPPTILGDDIATVASAASTTCSAPVVDTTESTYRNSEFCKVIVRTFVVKDLCDFSTVNSSITQGNVYDRVTASGLVAESVVDASGRHFIKFTRTIRIIDNTPPTSTPPTVAPVCATTVCSFGFSATLPGDDGCGTSSSSSSLFYSWRLVNAAGATVNSGSTASVSGSALAFGDYTVFYRVSDLCGNTSTEYSFPVTGRDCKAPQILVHNKLLELAGQVGNRGSGMATLLYIDIRNNIFDNCDGDLTNSNKVTMEIGGVTTATRPTAAIGTQSIMFNCDQAGTVQNVRVWAADASNNWNYVVTQITVQDNIGICRTPAPFIAGGVGTENGSPVKDVVISASANGVVAGAATASAAGAYQINNLTAGASYQVRAAKTIDTDKKNGVTTLDIALISKHLLGETDLNSPYKIIAADVDRNGEVEAADMLNIRRFILNITPSLASNSAWRFIDGAYAFRNATNPLVEDFPEVVSLSNVPSGSNAANFKAVKMGDVNNSFDATQVRGSRVLSFNANDMDVVAGNEYTVAIDASNLNAAAFQGTFAFEGATVKAVKAGNLNNVSDNNFGMFSNAVSASWNGKSEASDKNVLNITFVATKSGKLSEMLTVNSAITMAEGYDAAGNAMNVSLKFNTGKVAGGEFALYQNTPNPVALTTKIGFNLPKDGQAKLTIYTAEGKVLSVINNGYKAGFNEVTINKSDLNASGMLYYRLDTQDNSSTRKMIIIE
jgi:hypothetical protein